ncbi:leucine zipper domain-containing protein, partial [Streptomyces lunaelactis]|uniref:leucine zipper domain-containing protein n=1 Tax=Streptomyces lunaelactis TaxID=1535768 RepID=UPI001584AEF3
MSHRNARLTVFGRRLLAERVLAGSPVAHVAAEMGVSRPTAHKWMRRWRAEGEAGLHDRSSRPHTARLFFTTYSPLRREEITI